MSSPEGHSVARAANPRRIGLDEGRMGREGGGEVGKVAVHRRRAARNEEDASPASIVVTSHRTIVVIRRFRLP